MQALVYMMGTLTATEYHQIQQWQKTITWITFQPTTVNGTDLKAQKFRGYIFLHYSIESLNQLHSRYRCGSKIFTPHALNIKIVVLSRLVSMSYVTGSPPCSESHSRPHVHRMTPLIHTDHSIQGVKCHLDGLQKPNNPPLVQEYFKQEGELLIWELWHKGAYIIHYMNVVNTDSSSYLQRNI